MPRLLSPQHELFCRAFVRGPHAGNLVDAYEAAGYARDRGNACRLARTPEIAARINALREGEAAAERAAVRAALSRRGVDKARVVEELAGIALASPLDYLTTDADGQVAADFARVDRHNACAIREVLIEYAPGSDGKPRLSKLRLRLNDKLRALTELARHIDQAQEPALPVEDKAPPASVEAQRDKLVMQLRDLADFGEDVVDLAARATEAAKHIQRGWIDPTPPRLARLRTAVSDAANGMQQAVSEAVLVEEGEVADGAEARVGDGGGQGGRPDRHCEEGRRPDEAIQHGGADDDGRASPCAESALDRFVAKSAPRDDGASLALETANAASAPQ